MNWPGPRIPGLRLQVEVDSGVIGGPSAAAPRVGSRVQPGRRGYVEGRSTGTSFDRSAGA